MRGVVIHYDGRFKRFLRGRENGARLDVLTVNPVPKSLDAPPHPGERLPRDFWESPLRFVFTADAKTFAASRRVSLKMGRRFPEVEHWFVLPDEARHVPAPEFDARPAVPSGT